MTVGAVHRCSALHSARKAGVLCAAAVAGLEEKVGLQQAMLIVPLMYLLSGIGFFFAEKVVAGEKAATTAALPSR